MFRTLLLASIFSLAGCELTAPASRTELPVASAEQPYSVSQKMQEARNFLYTHAEGFLANPTDPNFGSGYAQSVTLMGREDLMALLPPEDLYHRKQDCSGDLQPALPEIREVASRHSLVILNESHSRPQHRAFIGEVVEMLRADGFTHYAAETLSVEGA